MTEQEMCEAMHAGQAAMSKLIESCGLEHGDRLVKLAEQISHHLLEVAVEAVKGMGLTDGKGISGDGAKVILLATNAVAISVALVGRIAKESQSQEEVSKLLKVADEIEREGRRKN